MADTRPTTVLCLASYEKGHDFLRECKRQGARVILYTLDKLADAPWPRESIDQLYTFSTLYDRQDLILQVSRLARETLIDRIVPLDDYDVEAAAALREHLRVPGMGDTTARYFRDKLAMRVQARDRGVLVPEFVPAINNEQIRDFITRVPGPWLLKPRSEASTVGIRMVHTAEELWPMLETLGDRQSYYVLEEYIQGDVFHVDALTYERQVMFDEVHRYGTPPFDVAHRGGIFTSCTMLRTGPEVRALRALHREVLMVLGFVRGVTHTEFIRSEADGRFYFLEAASRVAGAYIANMVEASTDINLWVEWAKIELAGGSQPYFPPPNRHDYAGMVISLARQEHPDTSAYNDPEIKWRLNQRHHAGLVVASPQVARVEELLASYTARFQDEFYASMPAPEKPTS